MLAHSYLIFKHQLALNRLEGCVFSVDFTFFIYRETNISRPMKHIRF
jgi:hypothetical protein